MNIIDFVSHHAVKYAWLFHSNVLVHCEIFELSFCTLNNRCFTGLVGRCSTVP